MNDRIEGLHFITPPNCQGEYSYAADGEGLVQRRTDRADREVSYYGSEWPADAAFDFAPQNVEPDHPELEWRRL